MLDLTFPLKNIVSLLTETDRINMRMSSSQTRLVEEMRSGHDSTNHYLTYMSAATGIPNMAAETFIPNILNVLEEGTNHTSDAIIRLQYMHISSLPIPASVFEEIKKKLISIPDTRLAKDFITFFTDNYPEYVPVLDSLFSLSASAMMKTGPLMDLTRLFSTKAFLNQDKLSIDAGDLKQYNAFYEDVIRRLFVSTTIVDITQIPNPSVLLGISGIGTHLYDALSADDKKNPELVAGAIAKANTVTQRQVCSLIDNRQYNKDPLEKALAYTWDIDRTVSERARPADGYFMVRYNTADDESESTTECTTYTYAFRQFSPESFKRILTGIHPMEFYE